MSTKKLSVFFILLLSFKLISAQILEPVKWSFDSRKVSDTECQLQFTANIEEGWHVYSQFVPGGGPVATSFKIDKSKDYTLVGTVSEPKAEEETDPNFNMVVKYFTDRVVFTQKVKVTSNKPVEVKGYLEFMCCDNQQCIPPSEVNFSFKLEGSKTAVTSEDVPGTTSATNIVVTGTTAATGVLATSSTVSPAVSSEDGFEKKNQSLWIFFWTAFGFGLLAILTPCVFPMIPMTVSYFMKSGKKGRGEAMIYSLAIIAIYVLFGVLISVLFGADFGNWLSTHWIPNVLFFLIFVIFAASFFGYFEITLPSWLVNKSVQNEEKGGVMGILFMALTLVLVSFSCTGPIVGLIVVQAVGGAVLKPVVGMLGFSLAFAIPFGLFAFFPRWLQKMPKSGGWLNSVKVVLGFIELAFALKFLNVPDQTYHWGILDREVYLGFWIVIFTMMAFYLLGKIRFPHDDDYPAVRSFPRLSLIIITFAFVVYLIPGLWGAPLKAISGWLPPMETQDFDINAIARENAGTGAGVVSQRGNLTEAPLYSDILKLPHGLKGYFDYDQALRVSGQLKKPVFVDFTGHGCTNCREMENRVWSDPRVLKLLRDEFVLVALYVDDKTIELPKEQQYTNAIGREVKLLGKKNTEIEINKFRFNAQPFYVILDGKGTLLVPANAYNLDVNVFVNFLKSGVEAYKKQQVI